MQKGQDAYGREIYDHFRGEELYEIVERDDGYIDSSMGPAAYFGTFEQWSEPLQRAIAFARGRVIDIGCGAGRHSLHLQEKGHDVLGIDVSPLALEVCRLRGLRQTRQLSITQVTGDLGIFDTILMLGNNFGLFGSFRRARWLLRRFDRLTSAEGRIIAEHLNPYQTDNPDHLAYHARNHARGRMGGQVRIRVRYHRDATPWFDYLLVSPDEMAEVLAGTGWAVAQRFGVGPMYAVVIEKTP